MPALSMQIRAYQKGVHCIKTILRKNSDLTRNTIINTTKSNAEITELANNIDLLPSSGGLKMANRRHFNPGLRDIELLFNCTVVLSLALSS